VNEGGAWGGFLYFAGAIVEFISGRYDEGAVITDWAGRAKPNCRRRRETRGVMRPEARTRTTERKKRTEMRVSLPMFRMDASVPVEGYLASTGCCMTD
jgi:hypothetical protein